MSLPQFELCSVFIYLLSGLSCSVVPELVCLPRRHIQDPASQRLTWNTSPKSVLVIKKIRDASLLEPFKELCRFLTEVGPLLSPPPGVNTSRWAANKVLNLQMRLRARCLFISSWSPSLNPSCPAASFFLIRNKTNQSDEGCHPETSNWLADSHPYSRSQTTPEAVRDSMQHHQLVDFLAISDSFPTPDHDLSTLV